MAKKADSGKSFPAIPSALLLSTIIYNLLVIWTCLLLLITCGMMIPNDFHIFRFTTNQIMGWLVNQHQEGKGMARKWSTMIYKGFHIYSYFVECINIGPLPDIFQSKFGKWRFLRSFVHSHSLISRYCTVFKPALRTLTSVCRNWFDSWFFLANWIQMLLQQRTAAISKGLVHISRMLHQFPIVWEVSEVGLPPVIIHSVGFSWIFHEINHPALGVVPFQEPPKICRSIPYFPARNAWIAWKVAAFAPRGNRCLASQCQLSLSCSTVSGLCHFFPNMGGGRNLNV